MRACAWVAYCCPSRCQQPQSAAASRPAALSARATRREGDQVCIEVRDNGPGIKQDVMARIREPLFTTKSFGTGLGLPAVEQILAQHHGSLTVDSEPGKFASFSMWRCN